MMQIKMDFSIYYRFYVLTNGILENMTGVVTKDGPYRNSLYKGYKQARKHQKTE